MTRATGRDAGRVDEEQHVAPGRCDMAVGRQLDRHLAAGRALYMEPDVALVHVEVVRHGAAPDERDPVDVRRGGGRDYGQRAAGDGDFPGAVGARAGLGDAAFARAAASQLAVGRRALAAARLTGGELRTGVELAIATDQGGLTARAAESPAVGASVACLLRAGHLRCFGRKRRARHRDAQCRRAPTRARVPRARGRILGRLSGRAPCGVAHDPRSNDPPEAW